MHRGAGVVPDLLPCSLGEPMESRVPFPGKLPSSPEGRQQKPWPLAFVAFLVRGWNPAGVGVQVRVGKTLEDEAS